MTVDVTVRVACAALEDVGLAADVAVRVVCTALEDVGLAANVAREAVWPALSAERRVPFLCCAWSVLPAQTLPLEGTVTHTT